ncbi:MAG: alanine racemase [Bacteroidetes bacterium HLUCCA01]|nr:MAG: alanine racemase [Bacteroidetes bacterium HLUCCA01]
MNRSELAGSVIEISRSALEQNYAFLRRKIGRDTLLSSVVKGNAYGHTIEVFVPLAESCGVQHFSVFSADEAWQVKQVASAGTDVMIMGSIPDEALEWSVEQEIEVVVFEADRLERLLAAAGKVGKKARIHLEVETGLNRTGFEPAAFDKLSGLLRSNAGRWELKGICTHYAGAESTGNYLRVRRQIKRFRNAVEELSERGVRAGRLHTACSAAALTYPETTMDMVRIGIAQYGFWPSRETWMHHYLKKPGEPDPLQRVMSWKSTVMSVKDVPAGDFIGYGTSYLASIPTRIATVPVGYTHGFARSLSNLGRVIVGGHRTAVVGLINMNMMMIDITEVPSVKRGDEVVIVGLQQDQEISVSSFSELSQNLNYETLVRLPAGIPRVVVD